MLQTVLYRLYSTITIPMIKKHTIFKAIMNTTEWELTLDLHEFDEPWMRFAQGFGCKRAISWAICHLFVSHESRLCHSRKPNDRVGTN